MKERKSSRAREREREKIDIVRSVFTFIHSVLPYFSLRSSVRRTRSHYIEFDAACLSTSYLFLLHRKRQPTTIISIEEEEEEKKKKTERREK